MINTAIVFWLLLHILIAFSLLINRNLYIFFIPIIILLEVSVYMLKPVSYDLFVYLDYFSNPHPYYEPLFYFTSLYLSFFNGGIYSQFILSCLVLLIYGVALRILGLSFLKIMFLLPLLPASIYFMLGSQNVIRQFISSSILILGLSIMVKAYFRTNNNFISLFILNFFTIFATGFHRSGIFFGSILILIHMMTTYKFTLQKMEITKYLLIFCGTTAAYFLIYLHGNDDTYLTKELDWGSERTGNLTKVVIFTVYLIISRYLTKGIYDNVLNYISSFRFNFAYFIIPFSFLSGELFPRLLFFFYALDVLWIMLLFKSNKLSSNARIFLFITFILYGFSPNVLNILGFALV